MKTTISHLLNSSKDPGCHLLAPAERNCWLWGTQHYPPPGGPAPVTGILSSFMVKDVEQELEGFAEAIAMAQHPHCPPSVWTIPFVWHYILVFRSAKWVSKENMKGWQINADISKWVFKLKSFLLTFLPWRYLTEYLSYNFFAVR